MLKGHDMFHFADKGQKSVFPFIRPGKNKVVGEVLTFSELNEAIVRADTFNDVTGLTERKVLTIECEDGSTE